MSKFPIAKTLDDAEMIKSFRSMVVEGSSMEAALIQVAFEEGCTEVEARTRLEGIVGDLKEFVLKDDF